MSMILVCVFLYLDQWKFDWESLEIIGVRVRIRGKFLVFRNILLTYIAQKMYWIILQIYITIISILSAAWKMSVFEVFLVCIFSHSNRIRREIFSLAISFRFSPNARKYEPENSEYGHISRSEDDFTLDTNIVSKGQKDTLC